MAIGGGHSGLGRGGDHQAVRPDWTGLGGKEITKQQHESISNNVTKRYAGKHGGGDIFPTFSVEAKCFFGVNMCVCMCYHIWSYH